MLRLLATCNGRTLHRIYTAPKAKITACVQPSSCTACVFRKSFALHTLTPHRIVCRSLHLTSTALQKAKSRNKAFEKYYPEDGVDADHLLIYTCRMENETKYSYMGLSGLMLLAGVSTIWTTYSLIGEETNELFDPENPYVMVVALGAFGIFIWVIMFRVIQATIFRVYYNQAKDSYLAITKNWLLRPSKFTFNIEDIRWRKPGLRGNYYINKRPVHLHEKDFKSSIHYKALVNRALQYMPKE